MDGVNNARRADKVCLIEESGGTHGTDSILVSGLVLGDCVGLVGIS